MNFMEMWSQMGLLAKAVVGVLIVQSVWSIGVMVERYITYRAALNQSRQFAPAVAEALGRGNLREALEIAEQYSKSHLARVVSAGLQEFQAHDDLTSIPSEVIDASTRALQRATAIAIEHFKRGLGGLATIGSTAPFVGLFGTTIGIINAFQGLGAGSTTTIQAVAPGISEALVATAAGLFAAIPALIAYNQFLGGLKVFGTEMDDFSIELLNLLERSFRR